MQSFSISRNIHCFEAVYEGFKSNNQRLSLWIPEMASMQRKPMQRQRGDGALSLPWQNAVVWVYRTIHPAWGTWRPHWSQLELQMCDLQNSYCAMAALSFMKLIHQVATNKCVKWIFNGIEKHTASVLITDKRHGVSTDVCLHIRTVYDILGCRTIPREANQSYLNRS